MNTLAADEAMSAQGPPVIGLAGAVGRVLTARVKTPPARAVLVALSGIDGSGKGHLAARTVARLRASGLKAITINVDGWLNLPHVRFDSVDAAGNFYRNALRLDDMFEQLVLPLRDQRSICVVSDFAEETALSYGTKTWSFQDVDVIVLEGIFLLKREYRRHYDVAFWIDCGFDTALGRAIARAQEGLSPEDTVRAYQTIYFPAQQIHFERDQPWAGVDGIIPNHHGAARTSTREPSDPLHRCRPRIEIQSA